MSTGGLTEDETGRVKLMTMHRSKGLEFPYVFLPAFEADIVPPAYGDAAEERRLVYVALTRGMRRVTISHRGYRRGEAKPSPFLTDIPDRNRVPGLLRRPAVAPRPRYAFTVDDLTGIELLQRL